VLTIKQEQQCTAIASAVVVWVVFAMRYTGGWCWTILLATALRLWVSFQKLGPLMLLPLVSDEPSLPVAAPNTFSLLSSSTTHHVEERNKYQKSETHNTLTATTTSTYTNNNMDSEVRIPAVCLKGSYGRNCNGIIQIANALDKARQMGGKLGLREGWTERYLEFFDPRDEDVVLNVPTENCPSWIKASRVHYFQPFNATNHALMDLIPKHSIRQAAQAALDSILLDQQKTTMNNDMHNHSIVTQEARKDASLVVVSVHRRWLEGSCNRRATNGEVFCIRQQSRRHGQLRQQPSSIPNMCNMTYQNVTDQLEQLEQEKDKEYDSITKNAVVVLFTDGQVPHLDDTFPLRDEHPFPVQLWMMALSDVHIGTPTSSVDHVVNHWRHGLRIQPSQCYPPL
jgi:hypothetical protein